MPEILSKETIALRLRDLRHNNGFSQQLVANYLGLSRSNYSQIELGNQFPTYDTLIKIAIFYNTSYEWILHGRELELGNKNSTVEHPFPELALDVPYNENSEHELRLVTCAEQSTYLTSRLDGSFIQSLRQLKSIANSCKSLAYRAFEVKDGSMKGSYLENDIVLTKSISNISELKTGETYIIVTSEEILMRKISLYINDKNSLIVNALNPEFPVRLISLDNILEIWQVCGIFSTPPIPIGEKIGRESELADYTLFNVRQDVNFFTPKVRGGK